MVFNHPRQKRAILLEMKKIEISTTKNLPHFPVNKKSDMVVGQKYLHVLGEITFDFV